MTLDELILKLETAKTLYDGDSSVIFQMGEHDNGVLVNVTFGYNAEVDTLGRVCGDNTEPYVRVKVTK